MNIAILTGGETGEREVALKSAQNVFNAISPLAETTLFKLPQDLPKLLDTYKNFDAAIPVFHGKGGEDGSIQGFLETLGLPYIFSEVQAHAMAIDKGITKKLVQQEGVQTAQWQVISKPEELTLEAPLVIKQITEGSSLGITIALTPEELEAGLKKELSNSPQVLVEQYIKGKEFTVPIIELDGQLKALPVIEIVPKNAFFDLEAKYDPTLCEEICPARIPDETAKALQDIALKTHQIMGCRHLSRSDFIIDEAGEMWFLEINTIPGMTNESLLPKAIRTEGLEFGELLFKWATDVQSS